MITLRDIQTKVYVYNESCNKKKLKIPSKISKTSEKEILECLFSSWVDENITFTSSKDTLHPNLISYLVNCKVCKIKKETNGRLKGWCYLENNYGKKINISKQIYFGYQFVEKLKKYKKKKFIRDFFDEDGFITILKLEEWIRSWNGVKNTRRLDFIFEIDIDKKIVIEYLEDHHLQELKNWNNYQTIRLVDIIFGHDRNDIIHFAFVWDNLLDDTYLENKVKFFCQICKDHYNIKNEEKYVINILNDQIKNRKMSKVLFDAYKNENEAIIRLSDVNSLFKIKNNKKAKDKFLETIKLMEGLDIEDSSNEEENSLFGDDEEESDSETTYYKEENEDIFLSNYGLYFYLNRLDIKDFKEINDYKDSILFINKIGKSAYESANKIRDLIINMKKHIISGLDEINTK